MSSALKHVHIYELIKLHARHSNCSPTTTIICVFLKPDDDSLPVGECMCVGVCECVRQIDFCRCIS